jgi:hypothetical protein
MGARFNDRRVVLGARLNRRFVFQLHPHIPRKRSRFSNTALSARQIEGLRNSAVADEVRMHFDDALTARRDGHLVLDGEVREGSEVVGGEIFAVVGSGNAVPVGGEVVSEAGGTAGGVGGAVHGEEVLGPVCTG